MIEIRQTEVYSKWFKSLRDRQARARIDVRIRRLSLGNPGDAKPVGEGVSELRIDYGPGYRVYFIQRGRRLWSCLPEETNTPNPGILKKRCVWRGNFKKKNQEIVMGKIQTQLWDAADHLETGEDMAAYLEAGEDMAAYLEAALEDGDPALIAAALGDIARAPAGLANPAGMPGLWQSSRAGVKISI